MEHDFLESIEEAALNAWTAPRQMLFDGWLLRFAEGYSKRVNSVNVRYSSRLPLDEKIAYCEGVYTRQGLPTLFRLPEPFTSPEICSALEARGYMSFDLTWVLGRQISAESALPLGVEVRQQTLAEWLQLRAALTETALSTWNIHRKIVDVIVPEKALMGLYADGQPVACGMGVLDGELLGYFSIFTGLSVRRRGFGRAMMDALTAWGVKKGAAFGYLQVEGDNTPALAMYAKMGFEQCYKYVYSKRER
jgi:ribosomal protein S18 acetylase RimI-like enzyme